MERWPQTHFSPLLPESSACCYYDYRYNFHYFWSSLKYKETAVRNLLEQRSKVMQQSVPLLYLKVRHGGLCVVHSYLWCLNIYKQTCGEWPRQNPYFPQMFSRDMELERESIYCFMCSKVSQWPFPWKSQNRWKALHGMCELLLNQAYHPLMLLAESPYRKREAQESHLQWPLFIDRDFVICVQSWDLLPHPSPNCLPIEMDWDLIFLFSKASI